MLKYRLKHLLKIELTARRENRVSPCKKKEICVLSNVFGVFGCERESDCGPFEVVGGELLGWRRARKAVNAQSLEITSNCKDFYGISFFYDL